MKMRDNRKSDNRETIKWDPFARVYIYIHWERIELLILDIASGRCIKVDFSILLGEEERERRIFIQFVSFFLPCKYLPGDIDLKRNGRRGRRRDTIKFEHEIDEINFRLIDNFPINCVLLNCLLLLLLL